MAHVIRYFDKHNEDYAGELALPSISLEKLQAIFKADADNPLYDSFPITKVEIYLINKEVSSAIDLDFSRYDYFLEYDG
jgi:hypothetical protein